MNKHIIFQEKRIAYQVKGQGPAIVFLHGFMEDRSMWQYHYDQLSTQYMCVAIDLPGHGQSEQIAAVHGMSLMAEVVASILQTENINKAMIIGHSMGGYIALEWAKAYPAKVDGLVLFNSHAAADTPASKQQRLRTIALVKENASRFINAFIPNLFAPANVERCKSTIEHQKQVAKGMKAEAIIAALAGMMEREDGKPVLEALSVPVLFIRGVQDKRIGYEVIEAQTAVCQHPRLLLLPYTGHMAWAEAPNTTLECLQAFAEECGNK